MSTSITPSACSFTATAAILGSGEAWDVDYSTLLAENTGYNYYRHEQDVFQTPLDGWFSALGVADPPVTGTEEVYGGSRWLAAYTTTSGGPAVDVLATGGSGGNGFDFRDRDLVFTIRVMISPSDFSAAWGPANWNGQRGNIIPSGATFYDTFWDPHVQDYYLYSMPTGAFVLGEILTGSVSLATAVLRRYWPGSNALQVGNSSGTVFIPGETVTGSVSTNAAAIGSPRAMAGTLMATVNSNASGDLVTIFTDRSSNTLQLLINSNGGIYLRNNSQLYHAAIAGFVHYTQKLGFYST